MKRLHVAEREGGGERGVGWGFLGGVGVGFFGWGGGGVFWVGWGETKLDSQDLRCPEEPRLPQLVA